MKNQIKFFIILVILFLISFNYNDLKNIFEKQYTNTDEQQYQSVIITPIPTKIVVLTPEPTVTMTPELPHSTTIIDKIGMHNKQINNILNHTDSNITKFIDKIEVFYSIGELNRYCENYNIYGCADKNNIAVISTQMYQARNDECSGDTCYYYKGSFAETLLHEIGHIEGMNLYNDNSEEYANNYSKTHYTYELEFSFGAEKIYNEYIQAGNKDNKHLN